MAELKVDLKLGTTLIPSYDGNPENLDSFVDAVLLFQNTVQNTFLAGTAAQQAAANETLLHLIKTKLTGKARDLVTANQNLTQILEVIKANCVSKVTAEATIAKLMAIKQKDNISDFCEQVEKITAQLKSIYLKDNIPEITANRMATKQGVSALIKGAKSTETKTILKAGTFTHLNEAVQKILENAEENAEEKHVFFSTNSRGRGRGFSHYRGNKNQHFQGNNYGKFDKGNFHGNRGNFQNRGNYHNNKKRGNWSQRGHHSGYQNPGMYCTVQNPVQIPQNNPPQSNLQRE